MRLTTALLLLVALGFVLLGADHHAEPVTAPPTVVSVASAMHVTDAETKAVADVAAALLPATICVFALACCILLVACAIARRRGRPRAPLTIVPRRSPPLRLPRSRTPLLTLARLSISRT